VEGSNRDWVTRWRSESTIIASPVSFSFSVILVDILPLYRSSHVLFCRVYVVFLSIMYVHEKSAAEACNSKEFHSSRNMPGVFYIFGQEEWRKCVLQVVGGHRLMPLGGGIPRPRRALARMIVARPRAVPIPLPFIAFTPVRLNIGAFCNISGTMKNRTMLPLM